MLTLCIPTYKSFDLCAKSIHAAMHGDMKPDRILVKDDSGTHASLSTLIELPKAYPLEIIISDKRDGVAGSWNILMGEAGEDFVIISNDDVEVHPHTLRALVTAAENQKNEVFFAGSGNSGNAFSLFLYRYHMWKKIPFDDYYWPAYFEDNDTKEMLDRAGYGIVTVDAATYDHVGSSTIARYTAAEMVEHHKQFQKNRAYFQHKWGGLPGESGLYKEPFNGKK